MRILFMGTPEFAVPAVEALASGESPVVAVVCQPDRPAGRGRKLAPPPVKVFAERRGIAVLQPEKLRLPETIEALRALRPDLIVVAAYGKILPPAVLSLPARGCINVHASLLPRYRGAAPIQWAILRGESVTGITIMRMDEGMDTGDILLQRQTPIGPSETCGELQDRLARLGAEALMEALALLERGALAPRRQDDALATMAPRIEKEHGRIDWCRPAVEIERRVRAFNPWPSAFTHHAGRLLKVHRAAVVAAVEGAVPGTVIEAREALVVRCGEGALRLDEVQAEGRQRTSGVAFARGARIGAGDCLA